MTSSSVIVPHLLPRMCIICETPVALSQHWPVCSSCVEAAASALHRRAPNRCRICSIPLPRSIRVCERCRREEFAFDRLVAVAPYRGLYARVLREFKFRRRTSLARLIGRLMAADLIDFPADSVLVPAPSSRRKVRRRGFAGADLIARELSACTGRPLIHALSLRGRREQKALDYEGRKANTRNVIGTRRRAQRELTASGRPVIVVDDVATTGTTADACARALREAGVRTVVVLVFAMEY